MAAGSTAYGSVLATTPFNTLKSYFGHLIDMADRLHLGSFGVYTAYNLSIRVLAKCEPSMIQEPVVLLAAVYMLTCKLLAGSDKKAFKPKSGRKVVHKAYCQVLKRDEKAVPPFSPVVEAYLGKAVDRERVVAKLIEYDCYVPARGLRSELMAELYEEFSWGEKEKVGRELAESSERREHRHSHHGRGERGESSSRRAHNHSHAEKGTQPTGSRNDVSDMGDSGAGGPPGAGAGNGLHDILRAGKADRHGREKRRASDTRTNGAPNGTPDGTPAPTENKRRKLDGPPATEHAHAARLDALRHALQCAYAATDMWTVAVATASQRNMHVLSALPSDIACTSYTHSIYEHLHVPPHLY